MRLTTARNKTPYQKNVPIKPSSPAFPSFPPLLRILASSLPLLPLPKKTPPSDLALDNQQHQCDSEVIPSELNPSSCDSNPSSIEFQVSPTGSKPTRQHRAMLLRFQNFRIQPSAFSLFLRRCGSNLATQPLPQNPDAGPCGSQASLSESNPGRSGFNPVPSESNPVSSESIPALSPRAANSPKIKPNPVTQIPSLYNRSPERFRAMFAATKLKGFVSL
jgi:hypothetical protein